MDASDVEPRTGCLLTFRTWSTPRGPWRLRVSTRRPLPSRLRSGVGREVCQFPPPPSCRVSLTTSVLGSYTSSIEPHRPDQVPRRNDPPPLRTRLRDTVHPCTPRPHSLPLVSLWTDLRFHPVRTPSGRTFTLGRVTDGGASTPTQWYEFSGLSWCRHFVTLVAT